jgi:mevalonate kinase
LHQPSGVGLGASAAIGVALARALSDALGVPSEQRPAAEILAAAQAWENVFHGKASGIDAATAYHGGCLWFRPAEPAEPLRIQRELRLAVAVAGPAVSTRLMVESVAAFRLQNPQRFEHLLHSIQALVHEARPTLLLGRQRELGALLDRNHSLLRDLGVSTPALDSACQQARDAGALGAKLTGGGGGGCVLALTEADSTERVLAAWRLQGLHCFEASVPGVAASGSRTSI